MDVRQARPTDAPLVLALALDEASHLVRGTDWPEGGPTLRTVLNSLLPVAMPGRVWIAHAGTCVALAEAQPRRYVIGWDIARLASRGSDEEVLAAVVLAAANYVQRRGIPRLFARCEDRGLETLCRLGFRPITRELVLAAPGPRAPQGHAPPAGSRYRMPQDAWPLHQLANAVTPALVRQLEGSTSLEWSDRPGKLVEIVVERAGQIVAWAGWQAKARQGSVPLGMVVHPSHADLARDLLSHVLEQAHTGARFVARVREYQESTVQAFLDAGFQLVARETVTVKHGLLVPAPVKRKVRVPGIPTIPVSPIVVGTRSGTTPATPGRDC
jgi:hypothetical protein